MDSVTLPHPGHRDYLKRTEAQRFEADKSGVPAKFKASLVWQGIV